MKQSKAIKIAVECIEQQMRKYAFDANMHLRLGMDTPHAVNSAKKYKDMAEAIKTLEALNSQARMFE